MDSRCQRKREEGVGPTLPPFHKLGGVRTIPSLESPGRQSLKTVLTGITVHMRNSALLRKLLKANVGSELHLCYATIAELARDRIGEKGRRQRWTSLP